MNTAFFSQWFSKLFSRLFSNLKITLSLKMVGLGMVLLILPSEAARVPFSSQVGSTSPSVDELSTDAWLAQCRSGRTSRPRGPLDVTIPYVISPRNTSLLNDRPSFVWNNVAGVNQYTISLQNGETVVWTKTVNTSTMPYPEEEAALQPGIDYTLLIETDSGSVSTADEEVQSFRLLPTGEAQAVKQSEAVLAAQPATDDAALLQASLYEGVGVYDAAIATLEARISEGTQSVTVYREVGNLYAQLGLPLLAESHYLDAVNLAGPNLEELAIVQAALGELYITIEDAREAVRWLTQAKESYAALGNQYQVDQLSDRLSELNSSALSRL